MHKIASLNEFSLFVLTKDLAIKFAHDIVVVLDQIPLVDKHTEEQILEEKKFGRVLHGKWEHSLIALDHENHFAGVIIGYERASEENEQYPQNSIYLNSLAVSGHYQKRGLGKFLLNEWLDYNKKIGFKYLKGNVVFTVQTNKAEWNRHIQHLYESFGFTKISEKSYDNRSDNVYRLIP